MLPLTFTNPLTGADLAGGQSLVPGLPAGRADHLHDPADHLVQEQVHPSLGIRIAMRGARPRELSPGQRHRLAGPRRYQVTGVAPGPRRLGCDRRVPATAVQIALTAFGALAIISGRNMR